MLSKYLGQDPDNPTYMEVLSGMEDCPNGVLPISTEEDLVVRERVSSRTERPSVREPGTNGNHAPIGKAQRILIIQRIWRYYQVWRIAQMGFYQYQLRKT